MNKKPNFIIAGVMKGSTSAAAINLNKHSDIHVVTGFRKRKVYERLTRTQFANHLESLKGGLSEGNSKELDFFNISDNYNLGLDFYSSFFQNKTFRGEASPNYFHSETESNYTKAIDLISSDLDNPKVIVILRDPITRAYSHWNMIQNLNPSWGSRFYGNTFNKSTEESPMANNLLNRSTYSSTLERYIEVLGSSNLYVALQEEIATNPLAEYNKMFTFLGATTLDKDPGFKQSFVSNYSGSIDSQSETWLKSYFKEDVDKVKTLFPDLQYSHWNSY